MLNSASQARIHHDHTGGIVWLVAAAVCVGFSVYAAQAKSNRYR